VALGFGRWRVHLFRCRADHLRRDSWLRERVMVERTQPNSEPPPQGLQVIDAPRASPETETVPVAWIASHPDRGLNWATMAYTQQGATSRLMMTDIAGDHGWSVIPLYAGLAQCQQEPVATVTDLRCAIDTAYSIANGSFPPFNVAEEIAAHILQKFDVRSKAGVADTSTDGNGETDVRWAVNVLLETIAAKFEAWDTLDLWRSDAAATVRGFKSAGMRGAAKQAIEEHRSMMPSQPSPTGDTK
jgi:hypothetical protein